MIHKKYRIFFIIVLNLFLIFNCSIRSVKEAEQKIEERFIKTFKNSKYSQTGTILVSSDQMKLRVKSAIGNVDDENKQIPASPDQPFHVASIGKIFTTVLIYQLIESGKLSLDSSVQKILGPDILKNLFVYESVDYSEKVTIQHLLSHTSGVEDYFESVDQKSKSVMDEITKEPTKFWTPLDLLEFTRIHQKAVSKPGEKFHYSDTGFILLGLVIEKISGKKLENVLLEKIFNPLGMKNSYMHLRSEPIAKSKLPISTMMLGKTNVTRYKSISADWAGGGIISTTEDLLLFQKALINGKLLSNPKTYFSWTGKNRFMDGIYYGTGLMTVRFGDMFFLMPNTPDLHGHSGLLSTQFFYSPEYDAHIILNLGSTEDVGDSFELMFWILQDLKEVQGLEQTKK